MWRDAPGFAQRFTAITSTDGHTMTGRWDLCRNGHTWNPDFHLTYTRDL